jgi:hypothetical protein
MILSILEANKKKKDSWHFSELQGCRYLVDEREFSIETCTKKEKKKKERVKYCFHFESLPEFRF